MVLHIDLAWLASVLLLAARVAGATVLIPIFGPVDVPGPVRVILAVAIAAALVSGIAGSLGDALQNATAGLSNWLKSYYRLNSAEIATVLASSIQYDIAEVVDPKIHVGAKIKKDVLAQIPKPPAPSDMFCQASWGCTLN